MYNITEIKLKNINIIKKLNNINKKIKNKDLISTRDSIVVYFILLIIIIQYKTFQSLK